MFMNSTVTFLCSSFSCKILDANDFDFQLCMLSVRKDFEISVENVLWQAETLYTLVKDAK